MKLPSKDIKVTSENCGNVQFSVKIVDNVLNLKPEKFVFTADKYLPYLRYLEVHIIKGIQIILCYDASVDVMIFNYHDSIPFMMH